MIAKGLPPAQHPLGRSATSGGLAVLLNVLFMIFTASQSAYTSERSRLDIFAHEASFCDVAPAVALAADVTWVCWWFQILALAVINNKG